MKLGILLNPTRIQLGFYWDSIGIQFIFQIGDFPDGLPPCRPMPQCHGWLFPTQEAPEEGEVATPEEPSFPSRFREQSEYFWFTFEQRCNGRSARGIGELLSKTRRYQALSEILKRSTIPTLCIWVTCLDCGLITKSVPNYIALKACWSTADIIHSYSLASSAQTIRGARDKD